VTGADFWASVTRRGAARCWLCEVWPADKGRCGQMSAGVLDAHHVIRKALLRVEFPLGALDQIVWDARNGVPVGRWHHDQVENARARIPRSVMPAGVEEFAAELGLGWRLDRDYGVREEAVA
jgi:hypothetical protein